MYTSIDDSIQTSETEEAAQLSELAARFWPAATGYGQPGTWFAYVGRTRQQRMGLTRLKPDRGPRGCRWGDPAGQVNALAGEVIA